MTQRAFGVWTCSFFVWEARLDLDTCCQKLVSFHAWHDADHVQAVPTDCADRACLQHVLSFPSMKLAQLFFTRWHGHHQHRCQFSTVFDVACIFYDFVDENTRKHWPDVTQRVFGVGTRSFFMWGQDWMLTRVAKSWCHFMRDMTQTMYKQCWLSVPIGHI